MRPSSSSSDPAGGPDTGAERARPSSARSSPGLFDELSARGAVRAETDDRAWLQALLDAEAALALARADCGLTSPPRARRVAAACRAERFDVAALGRDAAAGGNPVIPLVRELTALVGLDEGAGPGDGGAADEVHRGATSQDILDTGAMLVVRRSLGPLVEDLGRAAEWAAALARTHRDTPMVGRTLLQQAAPTTFGRKAAGWLVALDDAADRLVRLGDERLAVQLGGATGTLGGFDGRGLQVLERFAGRLGLRAPVVPWHTDRSRIGEVAAALAITAGAIGKVALDVVLLAQTEVGEVAEGVAGRGGSSAMPHKHNPVAATLARGAAAQAPGLAANLLASMGHEHERAAGPWHAEWRPLGELLRATGSAASWLADCLAHLRVDDGRLRSNLAERGDVLAGDRVAAALAPSLGRLTAHDLVAELTREAAAEGRPLGAVLAGDARVRPHLGPERLVDLLDPASGTGECAGLVDRALAHHAQRADQLPSVADTDQRS